MYPLLKAHLADNLDSVSSYLLLYHGATLANLLEVASNANYQAKMSRGCAVVPTLHLCFDAGYMYRGAGRKMQPAVDSFVVFWNQTRWQLGRR